MNIAQRITDSLGLAKNRLKGEIIKLYRPLSKPQGKKGDIWSERHLDPNYWQSLIHWGQIPQVENYINRSISGKENENFIDYCSRKYLSPLRKKKKIRMLSLCTGIGQLEIDMIKRDLVDEITGFEYSTDCVIAANSHAKEAGVERRVRFIQMDLNNPNFSEVGKFDFIFNEAALHHIKNLEALFAECLKVSSKETLFLNHDYIGPNHHQWTQKQLFFINKIMELLPDSLRASRSNPGAIHLHKNSLSLKQMMDIDPTEGVRSEDIIKVMEDYFSIVEFKNFGGTILHMLLNDMAGNFTAAEHESLINLLIMFEETLIKEGVLTSDFAFWVAKVK
jgi:SAM-dependent methyltransferase